MNSVLKGFRSVDATNYSTNVGNLSYGNHGDLVCNNENFKSC